MSYYSEEELRRMGPHVRRLVEHFERYHEPTDDEKREMGSRLRGVAHLILRSARRVEEGDIMAIGEMMQDRQVRWFVTRTIQSLAIGQALVDEAQQADSERN